MLEGFPGSKGSTKAHNCGSKRSRRGLRDALPRTSEKQMPSPYTGGSPGLGGGKVSLRTWGFRPENGTRISLLCAPMSAERLRSDPHAQVFAGAAREDS